jgi:hypothetical protein
MNQFCVLKCGEKYVGRPARPRTADDPESWEGLS